MICRRSPIQFTSLPSSSSTSLSLASLPSYGLQGTFSPAISSLMHSYNTAPPPDELTRAQTELNQVKDIMVQNVEQILSRGERIELLVDKTDTMASQATAFRRGARSVRRQMWWKNTKIMALSVVVGLVSRRLLFSSANSIFAWGLLTLLDPHRCCFG
jgi:vesicle-associated membrane protein 7